MTSCAQQSIRAAESSFGEPPVLVVGDLMLDKYIWGEVERISPEAPVPVLRAVRQSQQPGGAANVAMNLAGLGARVTVMGFGGDDDDRLALQGLLTENAIEHLIVACPGTQTTTKLRVLAGHQQLLRLDNEQKHPDFNGSADLLLERARAAVGQASVVVLSDYAKGVLSERVCRALIAEARHLQIPVVVDPKGSDFTRYRGATTICPNTKELAAVAGESPNELKWLLAAG